MKGLLFGTSGLGVAGAAFFGLADGADFDRVVDRSPIETYAAFSRVAQEGTISDPEPMNGHQFAFRTTKTLGESIDFEILMDNRPVATVDLNFAPGGTDGAQTRLTAEFDLDAYEIGTAMDTERGVTLSMIPETFFDMQFRSFMEDLVKDIEAGRPLQPLNLASLGVRDSYRGTSTSAEGVRSQIRQQQREAVRPMNSAAPMVDPDAAARNYRNTGSQNPGGGGWGR